MSRLAMQLPYSSVLLRSRDVAVKGEPEIPCWRQAAEPKFQSQVRHFAGLGFWNNEVHNRIPYLSTIDDVVEALIIKHPCLKEQGSVTGYYGWKISLKYKIGNYRTKLRNLGCTEMSINSMKNRQLSNSSSPNQVKKPRRAEVNFCPHYPAGEDRESPEKERVELLSEVKKRNNHQVIKEKMEKTFARRRYEVVQDMPFIAEFKSRWPALFMEHEASLEFAGHT